ncbi:MaoC/PaaZ C-terminal domain-containing protein [Achromobacter sp. UMC71]|uniref:MaoC/PaaZ C-terminal domain-containing protein n=1 Tax=Achromobacter sp. UMC71 TaxID=1862320 RepID=UPI0016004D13|nr:MaoC/PaaZ C-terminal domain-containing protein [Achromobacter sp. UMC71]MBB1625990.1 3-alpha,7-alpha,12-alpha-trihydroxy-5-beta-cholest-24-enoyl-CoA hydratase [Achromobacter sp. UMC71]
MSVIPDHLLNRTFEPRSHRYSESDTMLYALGCGLGADPQSAGQLRYVYEGVRGGLCALPTLANILGYQGFWADQPDTGIAWRKLVHAEQKIELQRPLPASGHVIGASRVVGLHDKGPDKGALMLQDRTITDAASGDLLATVTQTTMLRGDGGFGAAYGASHGLAPLPAHHLPNRTPDAVCELSTLPQAALLYRLNGDRNPLHADPAVAREAGFSRPILHGLATMGVALHAVLRALLGYDSSAVRGMRVRFTAPVLPGDTLRTDAWRDGNLISLRTTAVERDVMVLSAGRIDLSD